MLKWLFAKRTKPSASLRDLESPTSLARSLWDSAEMRTGEVELGGVKLPVTLELYAAARAAQRREDIDTARRAGRRIDHSAHALEFFTDALAMHAHGARRDGLSFEQWSTGCEGLVAVFKARIVPLAQGLDKGTAAGDKISVSMFQAAAPGLGAGVGFAFESLVTFLNGA